jgi:hypothetical protein
MRFIVIMAAAIFPFLAQAELPLEFQSCRQSTQSYLPLLKKDPAALDAAIADLDFSYFERRRLRAAVQDVETHSFSIRNRSNCKRWTKAKEENGKEYLRCQELLSEKEVHELLKEKQKKCEADAAAFNAKHKSEAFEMVCNSQRFKPKELFCEEAIPYFQNEAKEIEASCDAKSLRGIKPLHVVHYLSFDFTNKGKDRAATARRCEAVKGCVNQLDYVSKDEDRKKIQENKKTFCESYELGGFESVVKKMRELGIPFPSEKNRGNPDDTRDGPVIGAGSRDGRSSSAD